MDKKKLISSELQSWHWFIPLFAVVFVMFSFILSGNSYASIDYDLLIDGIDYVASHNNISGYNGTYPTLSQVQTCLDTYDNFIICPRADSFGIYFGYDLYYFDSINGGRIATTDTDNNYFPLYLFMGTSFWSYGSGYVSNFNNNYDNYAFSGDIYSNYNLTDVLYSSNLVSIPTNTITLTAGLTSFHRYQGVGDKEQLIVYLDGYVTEDFTFFVEQYIDNEWQIATGINDYYFLYNQQNNDIYRNPYYITFTYLSGLPSGTCRYVALLNDNPETAFYSDNFIITPWSIGNDATGTVDSNGDIDISIDTGSTVEGIADFLSQNPTVTQEQFSDNFPTVEVDDPSEDFFSWIFDQIENIFTSSTAQTLQFELFGTTYSYSSNDVYVPNNTLKTMIGLSCDFSICMWIIKDVRKVINKIKEGNIEALSDEDITANMV